MKRARIPRTTPEEREQYKLARRFRNWQQMIERSDKILARSQRALLVGEKVMKALLEKHYLSQRFLDEIKEAS